MIDASFVKRGFSLIYRMPTFNVPWKKAGLKNIVGKGENAGNQHFLLFPQCFLPFSHYDYQNVVGIMISFFDSLENIENAGCLIQAFSRFLMMLF